MSTLLNKHKVDDSISLSNTNGTLSQGDDINLDVQTKDNYTEDTGINDVDTNNSNTEDTLSSIFNDSYSSLHHSKQIQIGGKYISEGKYGCIMSPNLKCSSGKYSGVENDMVSKLVSDNNIEFEYDVLIGLGLDKIDPQMNYFLYPIDKCKPLLSNLKENSSELRKCNLIDKIALETIPENYNNIIIKNGGTSLDSIRRKQYKSKEDYYCEDYCLNYLSLITGIALLNKNSIYHRDIAHRNIVIDKHNDLRIIDFGLYSTKVANLESSKEDRWNDIIGLYSPEISLDIDVSIDKEINIGEDYPPKIVKTHYTKHARRVEEFSKIDDKIVVLLEIASELVETVYQEGDLDWRFSDKQVKNMFITMFEFLVDIHIKKIFKDGKENLYTNIQDKFDVFMIGVLLSRELQYCKTNATSFQKELENLVIKMTNLHPMHRISITDALLELVENISINLANNDAYMTSEVREKLDEGLQKHIQRINALNIGITFDDSSDEEEEEEDSGSSIETISG